MENLKSTLLLLDKFILSFVFEKRELAGNSCSRKGLMDLEELNQWLAQRNLKGHWERRPWSAVVNPYLWTLRECKDGSSRF